MHKLSHYENALHGTLEFPVAYYFVDKHHARYDMPLHWHKEWEIIHVLRGQFTLFADGSRYTAEAGDCFLLPEGIMHGGTPQNCVYQCLVFDLHSCYRDITMVKKYLRPLYRNQLIPQLYYPADSGPVASIVEDLMKSMHSPCPELSVLAQLSRLLSTILEGSYYKAADTEESTGSRKIAPLKPVLEYIETHYADNITLDDLSRVAGMNPRYFCRFFSSITNQTPMNYVNSYRIEQAAVMLDSGDVSVTEAGLSCGFGDTSYFIKCFKKYRGMTPKQYQRQSIG